MKTVTQVADELGVNRSSVWHHVKALGIGRMVGNVMILDASEVESVKERMLASQDSRGMVTVRQLMEETGLSRTGVINRIRRLGIVTEERQRIFLTEDQAEAVRRMGDDL